MDLGFSRFDTLRVDAAPVPLDYLQLVASLAAMQAASRTAGLEARLAGGTFACPHPVAALVALLAASGGWRESVGLLRGSFHPEVAAGMGGNGDVTNMTGSFTLARQPSFNAPH